MININESQLNSIQEFASERLTVKQKVYRLVQRFPYLAEDYVKLVWFYWHFYDESFKIINPDGKIDLDKFHRLTPTESITRAFRELCENKRIKLPWRTLDARQTQEVKYHHYYAARKVESL